MISEKPRCIVDDRLHDMVVHRDLPNETAQASELPQSETKLGGSLRLVCRPACGDQVGADPIAIPAQAWEPSSFAPPVCRTRRLSSTNPRRAGLHSTREESR